MYSEPCQISEMELFAKIVHGFQSLFIFAKSSISDVWHGSEYAPELALSAKIMQYILQTLNLSIRKNFGTLVKLMLRKIPANDQLTKYRNGSKHVN